MPESIVLAKWHAQQKDERKKMKIKGLREDKKELGSVDIYFNQRYIEAYYYPQIICRIKSKK